MDKPKIQDIELINAQTLADGVAQIEWKNLDGVDGYQVYKRNSFAKTQVLKAKLDAKQTTFSDDTNVSGSVNYYSIKPFVNEGEKAVNVGGEVKFTSVALDKVSIIKCKGTITGKVKFILSIVAGASGVIIEEKNANGEFEEVYRTKANTEFEVLYKTTAKGATYRARAFKVVDKKEYYGPYSEEVSRK